MYFPKIDRFGRPKFKLPNCPKCDEDELGVIHPKLVLCYACGFKLDKDDNDGSFPRVGVRISKVDRNGT